MSAWSDRFSGGSAVAGSGGRTFSGGGAPAASPYDPTPGGSSGSPQQDAPQPWGAASLNLLDPTESHGDSNPLSSILGGVTAAVGGTLERLGGGSEQSMHDKYMQLPEEFRKQFEATGNLSDSGLLGTGVFSNKEHYYGVALRQYAESQALAHPTFQPGAFQSGTSMADAVTNLFDLLNTGANAAARKWAEIATPGQNGMNRLDLIMKVGDGGGQPGTTGFAEDRGLLGTGFLAGDKTTGLNAAEQLVYAKVKAGDWTRDEALDFLASNGQAFGHSAVANIGGGLALDPLNIASFGAGAVAKLGETGLTFASRVERAGQLVEEAKTALQVAREGGDAAKIAEATDAVAAAQKTADAFSAYRSSAGGYRAANFLARVAEGNTKVADALKFAGKVYGGLEGTYIGKSAKLIRTLIDPLHAVDLSLPGATRGVDLYSDALPRSVVETLGQHHYVSILDDFASLDKTGALTEQFAKDVAVAATNHGREGILDLYRSTQTAAGLGEELMKTLPGDVFQTALETTKERDLLKWLRYNTVKNVLIENWDVPAKRQLAHDLEGTYHVRTADEWMQVFEKASKEQMSLLKYANYGNSNRRLLDAVANSAGHASALNFNLDRMVLVAKGTLTRVIGEDLLSKLTAAKSTKAKLDLIRKAQERFPSLRYVSIDEANISRSVDRFVQHLEQGMDKLPMEVTKDEIASMHPDMQDLASTLGDSYRLGFRPDDQFLWGLERDNATGLYHPVVQPWVDHVADSAMPFRPALAPRLNIMGNPIVDIPVARAAVKTVDRMAAAASVLKGQVSGAMVTEAARKRFVAKAVMSDLADHGVTEQVAQHWWDRIQEYTREQTGYSGPRGFAEGDLYGALRRGDLIPQPLLNGERKLQPHDVLRLIMEAYDGDIRYIGLTQKLSGRAKKWLFEATGSNFAGQVSEHAWPTLKFKLNPIFQLQEKIEPWVLNAQRGVNLATGVKMTKSDEATLKLLERMTDNSLVRQADIDIAEQSAAVLIGKGLRSTAMTPGTSLSKVQQMARSVTEVQGMKRLNMLRTFQKGLGKDLRSAWDAAHPGVFDDMKMSADLRAGRVLSDDEFALSLVSENMLANDVVVNRLGKAAGKVDWANSVKTGAWYTPTTLGELKPLDLDHVANALQLVNGEGKVIRTNPELRAALAAQSRKLSDVEDGLSRLGADPDYIRRVRNALEFSWGGFWKTAEERFSLTAEESSRLQDMVAQSASLRGMTPVDFMSQVFSPSIANGTEGALGHIDGMARLLREARAAGRKVKSKEAVFAETRTVLAGKAGESTREDLVRQLSAAFADHLDPSAKLALLREFRPELVDGIKSGKLGFDMADVNGMWDDLANNELAQRILGYMDGKRPTGVADQIVDETRGVKAARDAARRYMEARGVQPQPERLHFKLTPEVEKLYEDSAAAYSTIPSVDYLKTGRRPTITQIKNSGVELKPRPAGIDERTYSAYQDFVVDTRAQWDFMTKPEKQGGLGIKVIVAKGDPYTADEAGRLAMQKDLQKGQLRVFAGDADHPLLTNEQNVMFRAVHDVFGHAAEGFSFGPRGELNAAIKHSQMYSDTGRAAMLTETHGQTSWVNYSNDIVPDGAPLPKVQNADDFERLFPFEKPEGLGANDPFVADLNGETNYGTTEYLQLVVQERVGAGLRGLPETQQQTILQPLSDLQHQFPDFKAYHIDTPASFHTPVDEGGFGMTPDVNGVTWGADQNEAVVLLSPDVFEPGFAARSAQHNADFANKADYGFVDPENPYTTTRRRRLSEPGTLFNAGTGPEHIIRHEFGHVVDSALRPSLLGSSPVRLPEYAAYHDFMTEFDKSVARRQLSEYAHASTQESGAELFSVAFDPQLDLATLKPELRQAVEDYRKVLADMGVWKKPAGSPFAGMKVRDVNKAHRGSIYAEQKAGLLDQSILDQFGEQFVGRGKHVESNPDVARTAQMFGKWSQAVVANGLLKGEHSQFAGILADAAGLPTKAAVPYNFTEGSAINLAYQQMARKWDDAYRLQYFSQERSMLERSINHPMFGIYPASYMWGKIAPELARFLALEPFGNKTGGLLYSALDAQASIALRREWDPEFDAKIEELGHSQALSFLGYLLPALPWDVSASAPAWMRSLADQQAANDKLQRQGKPSNGISVIDPAVKAIEKLEPLTTTLPWAGRAIDEIRGPQNAQDAAKAAAEHNKLVHAAELGPTLQAAMQELQDALSH